MSWSKRQFIEQAFEEIGLAGYVFDLQPEQLQLALRRLDSMMGTWNAYGIRLGYPLQSNPGASDLDTETEVPDSANEAIYTNLAVRIAPSVGKLVSQDTKSIAKTAYNVLLAKSAIPLSMQFPGTMPSGAGNKPWNIDRPFLAPPVDPVLAGSDGPIEYD